MAFCTSCGAPIQEGDKFCTNCGTVFSAAPAPSGQPSVGPLSQQAQPEPARYQPPVYQPPSQGQPTHSQPSAQGQPNYSYQQPPQGQSAYNYQQPTQGQPAGRPQQPAYTYQQPVQGQPAYTYQQPAQGQSSYSYQQPAQGQPSYGYQQPAQGQPSYGYQQPVQGQPANPPVKKGMGVLCYLYLLILIPYFTSREDPFVKYHLNQGLLVFCGNVALNVINWVLQQAGPGVYASFSLVTDLLTVVVFVFTIIGIVHAAKGKMEPLPFIGDLFTFLK